MITPTAAAAPFGPIMARAGSVTIATGAITGIIAGITKLEASCGEWPKRIRRPMGA
jgi:hypothetical protein